VWSRTGRRSCLYSGHDLLAQALTYGTGHTPSVTLRCILVTNTKPHFVMLDGQVVNTSGR
jgi:hypothetical protein